MKMRFLLVALVLITGIWALENGIDYFLIQTGVLSKYLSFRGVYRELFLLGDVTLAILVATVFFYRAFTRQEHTLDELMAAHEKLKFREDQLRQVNRQLHALNRELQASMSRMESSHLQLQASEKKLREANAELTAQHAALAESKSRFQKMTDNVPGVVYQFLMMPDGAMSFPFASEKCRELIGIAAAAVQQDPAVVFGFIHPDDRSSFYTSIHESARMLSPWHWEGRFLVCGTLKWLKGASRPERQSDGSILWDGVIIDVTDLKRAEHSLKQSKQMLQLVLDTIPSAVFWKDRDSVYLGCNRVFLKDAGLTSEDTISRKTDLDLVWKDHAKRYRADDRQVMETNTAKMNFEEPLIKADHSSYWLSTSKVPMRDPEGKVIGVLGTYADITERKQAEEQLRFQGEIMSHIAEGVHVTRVSDAVIVYTNPKFEEMFGYGSGELIGKNVSVINAPTDKNPSEVASAIQEVLRKNGSWQGEVYNIRKDGTSFWCRANVSTFEHSQHGAVWVAIHEDITARKKAEDFIRASLQEKDVLLKEIHHRVKNNLQVISSLLNLQSQYIADPRDLQLFRESQTRLRTMGLIHERLYQTSDLAQTNFAEYLNQLSAELIRSYKTHDVRVQVEVEAHICLGIDLAIPCALIIHELMSNALKHAFVAPLPARISEAGRAPSEIRIILREDPGAGFLLIVSDNGVGLPPNIEAGHTKSLGWQLITALTAQIHGRLEIDRSHGTSVSIRLPKEKQSR